jgi:WhiB family redox-sensing transcriptional regulator
VDPVRLSPSTHNPGPSALSAELPAWYARAGCLGADTDLFFPEGKGGRATAAREICGPCDVMDDCRAYAIGQGITDGVWGGQTGKERRRVRRSAT